MPEDTYRKAGRFLLTVFLLSLVLVGTHKGEFWPFSIYPMFSQAGRPWTRALVRELPPQTEGEELWLDGDFQALPGKPYPLEKVGLNQNDLANAVSKSKSWDSTRLEAMVSMLKADQRRLMVMAVKGRLAEGHRVEISYRPFILIENGRATLTPRFGEPFP